MIFIVLSPRIKFSSWYYFIEEWIDLELIYKQKGMKLPAVHAAQAPALRELQGILAKANKSYGKNRRIYY